VRAETYGDPIDPDVAREIARGVVDYIEKNWDPAKRRQPPKQSRVDLSARNERLVNAREQSPRPVRVIAKDADISASQVSRVLRESGHSPRQDRVKATLSNGAAAVLAFLEATFPLNRVRAMGWEDFVCRASPVFHYEPDIAESLIAEWLAEITSSRLGVHTYFRGGTLIVARGRTMSEEAATQWLQNARPTSFIRQRSIPAHFGSLVWRDLLAVEVVMRQQALLDDWRVFVEASTVSERDVGVLQYYFASRTSELTPVELDHLSHLTVIDMQGMMYRIARGLGKRDEEDYIPAIRSWNRSWDTDFLSLSHLLDIVEESDGFISVDIFEAWLARTYYRDRIDTKCLAGRRVDDITHFIDAMKTAEAEDLDLAMALRSKAEAVPHFLIS